MANEEAGQAEGQTAADERQAKVLAERILRDQERGDPPSTPDLQALAGLVESTSREAAEALRRLSEKGPDISVADMFEMQMLMNRLSQLSEISSSVISATNSAISSIARNVKG